MKRVVLHIDQLVLKGARSADRFAIAESLRQELGRQLARPELARDLSARPSASRIQVGEVAIPDGSRSEQVGTQLGRGIARGLKA